MVCEFWVWSKSYIINRRGLWPILHPTIRGQPRWFSLTFGELSCCPSWHTVIGVYTLFTSPVNKYILLLVWVRPAQSLTGHSLVHMFSVIPETQAQKWTWQTPDRLLSDSYVAMLYWLDCAVKRCYCLLGFDTQEDSPVDVVKKVW